MISKSELRTEARALRKRLAVENPQAAEQVVAQLPYLLEMMFETTASFAEAQKQRRFTAGLYKAQGSEIGTAPLAEALMKLDLDLALPVAVAKDAALEFRRWTPKDPLAPDAAGIFSPLPSAEVVVPDVVFVPLLAIDRDGYRLGQGGGYYDRTIQALRQRPDRPWFIGLAYSGQSVDVLPRDAHDQRLDGLLTETLASSV
ncbi:MAG: 5-formyltetrahydrofolate cyclo-ligase [Caulobacterales bacterium]|nr:5-formyltetrahydrofolate cyclo-ligase [Caulobacterales bacterium]